jgi:RNA-binding protein YlmH
MFPISGLRIAPKNMKFASEFSHRDVLGSVLGLGLERDVIGDIYVKEKDAYLFCAERIATFLTEQLSQVRHTNVVCSLAQADEDAFEKEFQVVSRTVSAIRIDSVAAAVFGV